MHDFTLALDTTQLDPIVRQRRRNLLLLQSRELISREVHEDLGPGEQQVDRLEGMALCLNVQTTVSEAHIMGLMLFQQT